jgi:exoribonuclease R
LPVEGWNAQISLLTGMAAAGIMARGRIGLLRTMPAPDPATITKLRHSAAGLGIAWPESISYQDFIRGLDPKRAAHAALLSSAMELFRGVAYVAFSGDLPAETEHHAIGAQYAHVTAPLRRMADRFANEIVLSLAAGKSPPGWCVDSLPELPGRMKEADRKDAELERRIVDFVEAAVLSDRCGEMFEGVIVEVNKRGGTIQIREPAVRGPCIGASLHLGDTVRASLVEADPERGLVRFEVEAGD